MNEKRVDGQRDTIELSNEDDKPAVPRRQKTTAASVSDSSPSQGNVNDQDKEDEDDTPPRKGTLGAGSERHSFAANTGTNRGQARRLDRGQRLGSKRGQGRGEEV